MDEGPMELLSHLLETVPNLVEMRQQFLTNPAEIMRQVQENDPRLFELITANHQEFLELVNNEDLVTTLQQQQEMQAAFLDEEGAFEDDEEMEEAVGSLMAQYLLSGGGSDNSKATEDAGDSGQSETQRYLERVPTEEEEGKIEQLMQLGFTRDQCRVAFFKTKGSLERAANLLFEDPPQL
ncbi:hypothetical protein DQ04_01631060 [Trypanosoma grayi]|uniref:hypothetical protein n=1 Tax=Trypanosoma grayi TaxID=71804 RepID=UPI0004F48D66|nr:hypothetical protein DQ04_01631060 [Trypanosoma grayi]KEG12540.1 hypothetical protein DQ04_01631060 [Trypanosoma grayi]